MKQDLATAYRQNEEPKHQNKKESVKANPRSKTRKEKNNRGNRTHIVGLFFLLEALSGATLQLL